MRHNIWLYTHRVGLAAAFTALLTMVGVFLGGASGQAYQPLASHKSQVVFEQTLTAQEFCRLLSEATQGLTGLSVPPIEQDQADLEVIPSAPIQELIQALHNQSVKITNLATTEAEHAPVQFQFPILSQTITPPSVHPIRMMTAAARSMTMQGSQEAPKADYGDAPDELPTGYSNEFSDVVGHFPTLFKTMNSRIAGTPGAHALEVPVEKAESLGPQLSWEVDAHDPNDPDGTPNLIFDDFNDGLNVVPLPPLLKFTIKVGPQAANGPRYLNILVDLDRNGTWDPLGAIVRAASEGVQVVRVLPKTPAEGKLQPNDIIIQVGDKQKPTPEVFSAALKPGTTLLLKVRRGEQTLDVSVALSRDEWAVKNLAINVTPGQTREVSVPFPAELLEPLASSVSPAWMRVALTPIPLDTDLPWDGSGQFTSGEIEDYPIMGIRGDSFLGALARVVAQAAAAASDIALKVEQAKAAAQAAAEATTQAEAKVKSHADAFALAFAKAKAQAEAAAQAESSVAAQASAIADAAARAQASASQMLREVVRVPCGAVVVDLRAAASAAADAIARAQAIATSAAQAVAAAKASASAIATALSAAAATAESYAKAIAESKAAALAAAQATANAAALAFAQARALAQAASQITTLTRQIAIALAVGPHLQAAISSLTASFSQVQAQVITAAQAFAAAVAEAQAQASAAAVAQAKAEATAQAMAFAAALAAASAEATAKASAAAAAVAEAAAAAKAMAEAVATAIAKVSASVTSLVSGDCPRSFCRIDPTPVSLAVRAFWNNEELKDVIVNVSGTAYRTPATVRLEMGDRVNISFALSTTVATVQLVCWWDPYRGPVCEPRLIVKTLFFSHAECAGLRSSSASFGFTIKENTTCRAYYRE
jgi:hypothetical protein